MDQKNTNNDFQYRTEILNELHARPFISIPAPSRILHYGFLTSQEDAKKDRAQLEAFCKKHDFPTPAPHAKFHKITHKNWQLRWEQHTEFTTYSFNRAEMEADDLTPLKAAEFPFKLFGLEAPGDLLVSTEIYLISNELDKKKLSAFFTPSSLCMIKVDGGAATVATDFKPKEIETGREWTRYVIMYSGLSPVRSGVIVQRVTELETYRLMALLGLPTLRDALPAVQKTEGELAALTRSIADAETIETHQNLLNELTDIAARAEAKAAETSVRFAASKAYFDVMEDRLEALRQERIKGYRSFSAFLSRRLQPAVATMLSVDGRQDKVSRKLMRTAELLRTKIQFELEHQNRSLLKSMNRRAKLQLRLQQTVEGLSIAAISYYIIGLISYVVKGVNKDGLLWGLSDKLVIALCVPLVIAFVWLMLRRIHHKFGGG